MRKAVIALRTSRRPWSSSSSARESCRMRIKRIAFVIFLVLLVVFILACLYLYMANQQDAYVSRVLKQDMVRAEAQSFRQLPLVTVDDSNTGAQYLAPYLSDPRLTEKVFKHDLILLVNQSKLPFQVRVINAWLSSPDFTDGNAVVFATYRNGLGQIRNLQILQDFAVPHYPVKH